MDYSKIKTLMRTWYERVTLPMDAPLEAAFRNHQRVHAINVFRVNIVFIGLIYLMVGWGIFSLMAPATLPRWLSLYAGIGTVIVIAAALSWWRRMDQWFHVYVGTASFIAVALSVAINGIFTDAASGQLTQATINYCMVIIYGLVGQRFSQGMLAGWLGGIAGVALIALMGGNISWELCLVTYAGSNLLGMCLAYYNEHHSRAMFLLQLNRIDQLEHLVSEDPLTGLANRRHLDRHMTQEWQRASRQQKSLALLMIDIDRFKTYNDHFGHVGGDTCLRSIAEIIGRFARRPGDLAARYGGEEFALLLPNMDIDEAARHTERLLAEIRAAAIPHAPTAGRPAVSVSIGLAVTIPLAQRPPEWLVENADHAMYEAKHGGGDCYRFSIPHLATSSAAVKIAHPALAIKP